MNHEREMVAMAEGYLELGEFQEAWDFTETIPCIQGICSGIVRVRIICAIALRHFEIAEELVCFLGTGPFPFRKFAGGILHELAGAYCHAGDTEHARKLISYAIKIWPDESFSIIENRRWRVCSSVRCRSTSQRTISEVLRYYPPLRQLKQSQQGTGLLANGVCWKE